jgi:HD-GYP domain-containing protein (c-di-GMP phosphodiesterase class II)
MTTERPYRKAMTLDQAVDELRRCSGTQFDPVVVETLVASIESDLDTVAGDVEYLPLREVGATR